MTVLRSLLHNLPGYFWSGWGAIASLFLLLAGWEVISLQYGALVLPSPLETFRQLGQMIDSGDALIDISITARRALTGFVLSVSVGTVLGMLAGISMTASMMSRPWVTVLLGMPPIAWLVLAMLWFGAGDGTPVFTVFVAGFPLVFVGALQGTRTLDNQLKNMAVAFRLPRRMLFFDVYLPHLVSYLFPAWITALAMSWKIVVMAELFATQEGVGAALAVSRSRLDTAATMAWIVALVVLLLAIEYLILEPVKREIERWRESGA